jgi:ALG6, ALG8 glycosyltransferase family
VTSVFTALVIVPVVVRMWREIASHNFCKYLALVNFVAYNFGYHVHEKAIMMVYIPLLIGSKTQID